MANSLVISSLTNNLDGFRARASLDGTPAGTLHFYASRTPVYTQAAPVPHQIDINGSYLISLNSQALWYVWAVDDNGPTAIESAVLMGLTADENLNGIGSQLESILWSNRRGIEAAMRQVYANATLKQVRYGNVADINDWPSILITNPRWRGGYVTDSWGREYNVTYTIQCSVIHEEEQSLLPLVSKMAETAAYILIQPAYETIQLPNGVEVNFGQVNDLSIDERPLGDSNRFGAMASLIWTGNFLRWDGGM